MNDRICSATFGNMILITGVSDELEAILVKRRLIKVSRGKPLKFQESSVNFLKKKFNIEKVFYITRNKDSIEKFFKYLYKNNIEIEFMDMDSFAAVSFLA